MKNSIDINIIVDRSGSMASIQTQMMDGFHEFLDKQIAAKVEGTLSLYQFDDQYEQVFNNVDFNDKSLKDWSLVPRGMTALYDAVGKAIASTGERLAKLDEKDRPDKVLFLIITDGMENASVEYKQEKIKEMIEHQKVKYSWEFIYLGADQDAITVGQSIGIGAGTSAVYTRGSTKNSFGLVGNKVASFYASGAGISYSAADRAFITAN